VIGNFHITFFVMFQVKLDESSSRFMKLVVNCHGMLKM